jgi:hypothetical protein
MSLSFSTTASGGRPPWLRPTLMLPPRAWKRMPISSAAWMLSSSLQPLG